MLLMQFLPIMSELQIYVYVFSPGSAVPGEDTTPPVKEAAKPDTGISGDEGNSPIEEAVEDAMPQADGEPDDAATVRSPARPGSGDPPETSFGSIFDSVFGGDEDGTPQGEGGNPAD